LIKQKLEPISILNAIRLNQAAWIPATLILLINTNALGCRLSARDVETNIGIKTNNVTMEIYLGVEIARFKSDINA
jgi:hypothetical protein